jgi:hypothetical protein
VHERASIHSSGGCPRSGLLSSPEDDGGDNIGVADLEDCLEDCTGWAWTRQRFNDWKAAGCSSKSGLLSSPDDDFVGVADREDGLEDGLAWTRQRFNDWNAERLCTAVASKGSERSGLL